MSDILNQSLSKVYGDSVRRWQSLDQWGRARMMAEADARGDGDLLAEALKTAPLEEQKGGVARILGKIRGTNEQESYPTEGGQPDGADLSSQADWGQRSEGGQVNGQQ